MKYQTLLRESMMARALVGLVFLRRNDFYTGGLSFQGRRRSWGVKSDDRFSTVKPLHPAFRRQNCLASNSGKQCST